MAFQYTDDENISVQIFQGYGHEAARQVSKDVNDFIAERHLADHRIVDIRMSGASGGNSEDFAAAVLVMVIYAH